MGRAESPSAAGAAPVHSATADPDAMRTAALALALLALALLAPALLAPAALAQTPCTGGQAGPHSCERVDMAAHLPVGSFAVTGSPAPSANSDMWGWTDPETGREYAIVGSSNGTSFVDVTVPTAPVFLGKLPTASGERIWRDIKTIGDWAYIVSEADSHGMQVFDLKRLRDVASPPVAFTADALYDGIGSAHNIVVSEAGDLAIAVGATQNGFACNGGGLHVIDVSTPTAPTFAGCYDDAGYTHDAQCVLYDGPDADYAGREICVNYNANRVSIVDVTDPADVTAIADVFYPNPGYTHQGWFTDDLRHVLVNDEADEDGTSGTRTIVLDVEDLDNPAFAFFHFGTATSTDHNLYTVGDLVYQSNYGAGLQILRVGDLASDTMEEVGHFRASGGSQWSNYPYFASGTVVVNDISAGLFVLLPDPALVLADGAAPGGAAALSAPQPNPAAGTSTLTLTVGQAQAVRAELLDVAGRRVATLFDGVATPGAPVTLTVDGAALPAGVYVVRARGETLDASQRVTLTR